MHQKHKSRPKRSGFLAVGYVGMHFPYGFRTEASFGDRYSVSD